MSPITARATEIRVMQHYAQQLAILLSRLDQGLLLCGANPEQHPSRQFLVEAIRLSHERIGTLIGAQTLVTGDADAWGEYLESSRGLTP